MSRPQFIHFMKDMLLLALERTGGTDEFATIISLVMEDADPIHRGTFRLQLELLSKSWPKN